MQAPFDIPADLDTPVSVFRKLSPFSPCFLLESAESGTQLARYSFIGLDAAFTARLPADGSPVQIRKGGTVEEMAAPTDSAGFLALLRELRDRAPALSPIPGSVPFAGGIVGVSGYDAVRFFEPLPAPAGREATSPVALYCAPRSVLVFDHLTRRMALLHAGEDWERESLRREMVHAMRGAHPAESVRSGHAPPSHSVSEPDFLDQVAAAKKDIYDGEVFQLVLSIRSTGEAHTEPFQVYRALRMLNPSAYMYFLDIEGVRVVGASPEALFRCHGGQAMLRPIAGTRKRGQSEEEDRALEAELNADPKEAAEHVMLVDLARNDLGRVAKPGTIRVDPFRTIERYSHVMHLVSGVRGELEDSADAMDLMAASFPAGTLVGTPKVRAMQLIDGYEPVGRGFYAGAVGYFAKPINGALAGADKAICIRTLVFEDGAYAYQAGAGIVADSQPQAEYQEVRSKVAVLEKALELARGGW
ncbi:MAG: anthranilate synthase component I family protein [Phycisphaerales bacterium]|jgi:anthranilate synthase component 1